MARKETITTPLGNKYIIRALPPTFLTFYLGKFLPEEIDEQRKTTLTIKEILGKLPPDEAWGLVAKIVKAGTVEPKIDDIFELGEDADILFASIFDVSKPSEGYGDFFSKKDVTT